MWGKVTFLIIILQCDSKDNIFYKEKYYSELTFQYWYWKNNNLNEQIGLDFVKKEDFGLIKIL